MMIVNRTSSLLCLLLTLLTPALLHAQTPTLATGTTAPQEATGTSSIKSDPAGHACCALPPPGKIEVFMEDGELVIREKGGSSALWLAAMRSFSIDSNLQFTGQSTANVAGFDDILTVITGTISPNSISAEVRHGANGLLPAGEAIVYTWEIGLAPSTEWFFMGLSAPAHTLDISIGVPTFTLTDQEIQEGNTIDLQLAMNTGGNTSNADWWIVMLSGNNVLSFDLVTGQFVPGLVPTYQGPLMDIPDPVQLLNGFAAPSNDFTIVFGVDTEANGQVDESLLTGTGVHYYFF